MNNIKGTINWNNFLQQLIDNWFIILVIIFSLFILFLIGLLIYNRIFKKIEGDIIKIKTKNIRTTSWDVIIWKWNTKNK